MSPSQNWGKQGNWPPKRNPEVEHKIVEEETLKDKLDKMSLKELREYCKLHNLKAKDNDKESLVKEILSEE